MILLIQNMIHLYLFSKNQGTIHANEYFTKISTNLSFKDEYSSLHYFLGIKVIPISKDLFLSHSE